MDFQKEKRYLLCFDSDGTVMDTMTVKHERSFGPNFIKVFGIEEGKEDILTHWLNVNLYEKTRGINRFQGLSEILHYAKKYGYCYPGEDAFHAWVSNTPKFSAQLLKEEAGRVEDDTTIRLALLWSDEVNKDIVALPPSSSFRGVEEVLPRLAEHADLLGVSSANKAAVLEEWDRLGFSPYFRHIACQDEGSKTAIIAAGLSRGYDRHDVIMVGDAVGDLIAAENNGVYFYPIIPGHESECWALLEEKALKPLLEGKFDDDYQKKLNDEFLQALEKGN